MKYIVQVGLLKEDIVEAKNKREAVSKLLKRTLENLSGSDFEYSVMNFSKKNESTIFQIKNITFFRSCDAKSKNKSSQ